MATQEQIDQAYQVMVALVPALSKFNEDVIEIWIDMASDFVCENRFDTKYPRALALYSLHLMFMDGAFKSTTDIKAYSQRVASFSLSGEFSQTFATVTSNSSGDSLNDTPWGKMYKSLNRRMGGGFGLMTSGSRGC